MVLRPIAEPIGAEMILVTGERSDRLIAELAKRASQDGRPAVVLYFADFDPSGHEMPANVGRKLQALRDLYHPDLNIRLYQVALTLDQIRTLGLPNSPLKDTEKRKGRWREVMGHEQTEIDALVELHPEALRQAVFAAIRPFYDAGLDARVEVAESKWQERAEEQLRSHPAYERARNRIVAAHQRVRAAENLHNEQHRLAALLVDTIPPPPALPEAQPDGTAKLPLFDSDSDFVTATRRLSRHKRLDSDDDDAGPDDDGDLDEDPDDEDRHFDIDSRFPAGPTLSINPHGSTTTEPVTTADGQPEGKVEYAAPPRPLPILRPRGISPMVQAARETPPPIRGPRR